MTAICLGNGSDNKTTSSHISYNSIYQMKLTVRDPGHFAGVYLVHIIGICFS